MTDKQAFARLCHDLYDRGLGELLMMEKHGDKAMLGNLTMEKGRLLFKNRKIFEDVPTAMVAPCWDIGIIGAVCDLPGNDWESLTFLGPDHCRIPVDLSSTRYNLLRGISGPQGEHLISFKGSVYRAFQGMLESHLLPVVVPLPLHTDAGVPGIAVSDLRFASIPLEVAMQVNMLVRESTERQMTLMVEDLDVDDSEFEALFGAYTHTGEA